MMPRFLDKRKVFYSMIQSFNVGPKQALNKILAGGMVPANDLNGEKGK